MTQVRQICSLPLGDWPLADRSALERALAPDDDGSGEYGQAAHLRAATIVSYTQTYGQFLDFLGRNNTLFEAEGPGDRTTPQRVTAWRKENKARGLAPTTRRQMLRNLGAVLRLLVPERDWRFVTRPGGISLKRAIRGMPKPVIVRESPRSWSACVGCIVRALSLRTAPENGVRFGMRPYSRSCFPGPHGCAAFGR
ncbi:hypothetical protein AAFN86_28925 [Roseomonas sp. CAU 1739]|uniref:hypothetical protein n=1 Tax=Roseomonas sp. CAU 1739 TaxID=3140364 RepID=UPI00325AC179